MNDAGALRAVDDVQLPPPHVAATTRPSCPQRCSTHDCACWHCLATLLPCALSAALFNGAPQLYRCAYSIHPQAYFHSSQIRFEAAIVDKLGINCLCQVARRLFQMPLIVVLFALLQFSICLAADFDGISMPIAASGPLAPWVCQLVRYFGYRVLTPSHPGVPRICYNSVALLQLRAVYQRNCTKVLQFALRFLSALSFSSHHNCSIELTRAHLHSALIAQRLRSIDVDIIMLDDGSSDESLSLLMSIAGNPLFRNYTVIPLSPNGGAAAARNAGVSAATGKVIAFAESDDWYLEHHLWSCLSPFIKDPNVAFTKTKIYMGNDIHPHWQTGVEDVSPLNTCARREAFLFSGGFPTTDLFRDDMEDGHMAIIMHSLYRGAKIYTHTSRYRIREGNQLHQRMPQFTSAPGQAPLIQSDIENTDKRMAAIQEATVVAKDRLAEYQDLDMLSTIDPLSPTGRATHAQRRRRFLAPSFPVLQVYFYSILFWLAVNASRKHE